MFSRNKIILILQTIVLLILLLTYFISIDLSLNTNNSIWILCLVFISFSLLILRKEYCNEIKQQYVRVMPVFLFAYCIVYFQLHIDYILGNFDETNTRFWVNTKIVPKSLAISAIGFVSFIIGYSYQLSNVTTKAIIHKKHSTFPLKIFSLVFLFGMFITINPLYVLGGYGLFDMGDFARYFSILFELSITALIVQNVINLSTSNKQDYTFIRYVLSFGLLPLLLITLYLLVVIISGDRGPLIYLSMAFISSFIVLAKHKLSKLKIISSIIVVSFIISGLVSIRSNRTNTSFFNKVYTGITEGVKPYKALRGIDSFSNSTLELATSVRCLHNTVHNVPSNDGYFLGRFQLFQLMTVIPLGQLVLTDLYNLKRFETTSERYITYLAGGTDGSEGTACVADLYLDFGLLGVTIGLLLFGFFIRFIEIRSLSKNTPSLIVLSCYIVFCQYAIYIPRSSILLNVRNIIWVIIIIKLSQLITNFKFTPYNEK